MPAKQYPAKSTRAYTPPQPYTDEPRPAIAARSVAGPGAGAQAPAGARRKLKPLHGRSVAVPMRKARYPSRRISRPTARR